MQDVRDTGARRQTERDCQRITATLLTWAHTLRPTSICSMRQDREVMRACGQAM